VGADDRLFSRFIPKERLGEAASWEFQPLGGGADGAARGPEKLLSERERRAYERGRQEGIAAGQQAAFAQRAQTAQQLERVLDQLRARFAELESAGADRVLDLAVMLAAQVLRREVQTDCDALLPPLREAIAAVIDQNTHPRVHMNPQDHALLRDELEADGLFRGCRFIADPAVTRGGCRVDTAQCEIDATLESRFARVLAAVGLEASS
jgi:flagellar assembly protein FliH